MIIIKTKDDVCQKGIAAQVHLVRYVGRS